MENKSYLGRSNRETWLVGLWYNTETLEDIEYAQQDIEEKIDNLGAGFLSDLINISEINREEIKNTIETK